MSQEHYKEVSQNNKTLYQCSLCSRLLSRKQRIQEHLTQIHGLEEYGKKKYKRYYAESTIPMPRTTAYRQRVKAQTGQYSDLYPYDQSYKNSELLTTEQEILELRSTGHADTDTESDDQQDTFHCDYEIADSTKCQYEESNQQAVDYPCQPHLGDSPIEQAMKKDTDNSDCLIEEDAFSDCDSDYSYSSDAFDALTNSDDGEDSDTDIADDESCGMPNNELPSVSFYDSACMAILSYMNRHCITSEAAKDLIELLKVVCPGDDTVSELNFCKVQEVCGKCSTVVYDVCDQCMTIFPVEDPDTYACSTDGCNGLRYKGNENQQHRHQHKNSFATTNIKEQLKDLLERDGIWETIQSRNQKRGRDILTDITDGKFYLKLCEEGGFLHSKSNISLIFNSDGAPLYKSSSVSLWPVFLAVNELPSPERFSKRNMLMWGIWQGKGKPPFNSYLEPFASCMTELYDEGLWISPPNAETLVQVKAAVILGSADLQGKAYLLNMTQHNGEFGCLSCTDPGSVVKQGKGHTRCYPYKAGSDKPSPRTSKTFLASGLEAHELSSKKKVKGVYDVTTLADMPWFDLVLGMVPDYMNGCLLGITRTLMYNWFSPTKYKKAFFIGGKIKKINKLVLQMKPPEFIARFPRDVEKHYKNFKASELQAWLLYYSLPCLFGILPHKYLRHFAHFSEAVHILLGDAITLDEICRARGLLDRFYMNFSDLYGQGSCGLNVHNAGAHLVDYVTGWGPLWAWSTFGFEDMNGTIMKYAHGTGNVCKQLIMMLHEQSRLRCEVDLMVNSALKEFIKRMLNTKREVKNLKDAGACQIAGGVKKLEGISPELEEMIRGFCKGTQIVQAARIVYKGQVFFSKQYTRMVKRNACVLLLEGGFIGEVEFFVWDKDNNCTLVVYREVLPDQTKTFFYDEAGCHIVRVKCERLDEVHVELITKIREKVFYLDGNKEYPCIVRVPNFCGVCG